MNQDARTDASPISSSADSLDKDPEVQREGNGHLEDDEPTYPEQRHDPLGIAGPSYEMDQVVRGKEVHPGGSVSENSNRSHADKVIEDGD